MEFYDPRHSTYNVQLNSITAIDPDGILTEGPAAVDRYGFVGDHKQASWVFLHLLSTGNAALLKYCYVIILFCPHILYYGRHAGSHSKGVFSAVFLEHKTRKSQLAGIFMTLWIQMMKETSRQVFDTTVPV